MRYASHIVILAICFINIVSCKPKGILFDGKKAKTVLIADLGELFSTYNMNGSEKEEVRNQLTNKDLLDEIITYSKEAEWPEAVNSLEKRLKVRSTIMKYHFYKVAQFGDKTIISVPKEKNKHMPAGFIPAGPMYMVFATNVVISK
jgi:hypothetical protein